MKCFAQLLKSLILAVLLIFAESVHGQQITINEFMSSNSSTIADEDGDFEDWIEIYNYGAETLNLAGFGLSDDLDEPLKWVFPEITLQPEGFLIIWASGKDRNGMLSPLHTNFSIKAEGEDLLLSNPSGEIICEIAPLNLPTDISFGQSPDAAGEWLYFDEPTPGQSNTTQGYSEILEPPVFSHVGGFYSEEFELTLSHPDPDVSIYYTTDGSNPDPENLDGTVFYYKNQYPENPGDPFGDSLAGSFMSYLFNDPIYIVDRSSQPDSLTGISTTWQLTPDYFPANPVFKGTVIRACAMREGAMKSPLITHTYFVHPPNKMNYTLPVISLAVAETDLFDYQTGVYTAGIDYDEWRMTYPDGIHNYLTAANFRRRGDESEKVASIEIFEEGYKASNFSQTIGIRLHGEESRSRPMKSLRLYSRNDYSQSHMDYPFFKNEGDSCFKRIILGNSGQDFVKTMFRDALIHLICENLHFDTQAYSPYILFINGEYWGIHNARERYDKYFLERVHDVHPDSIDFLYNNMGVNDGDAIHYQQTISYIENNGLAADEHYQYITTRIDPDNFMDYQIANIYADNRDWPGNNLKYWRLKTNDYQPDAPCCHDGRWRWLFSDLDFSFGFWGGSTAAMNNTLEFATQPGGTNWPNPDWSTFLLRKLLENEGFKQKFINRFADLLNTHFLPERINSLAANLKSRLEPEMEEHIARWSTPETIQNWNDNVEVFYSYAEQRPAYQRQHIIEYFGLLGDYELTLNVSNQWQGFIKVNTIAIADQTPGVSDDPYPWSGKYFTGVPVDLEAIAQPGYVFSHWEGDIVETSSTVTIIPDNDFNAKAVFIRDFSPQLISSWLLDNTLPNDTPLENIESTYSLTEGAGLVFHSALEGYPFDPEHPEWRKASMERRNAPTPINYRPEGNNSIPYENANMRGLQIRQPFTGDGGENTLIFNLPTTGFEDVVFRFAAKDEDAADFLMFDYATNAGNPQWTNAGLENPYPELDEEYQLFEIDFSGIEAADDNEDFKIRIRFGGDNLSADDGDRVTFNNFSLDGTPLEGENLPPVVINPPGLQGVVEEGNPLEIDLDDVFMDPDNDPLLFTAISNRPFMAGVQISGNVLTILPNQRGDATITLGTTDSNHDPVYVAFRVMVYPRPFILHSNDFAFVEWAADNPDYSYPENILFLQSDENDPGLSDPLLYPYFIPHSDYHPDDEGTFGFPYNNTRRTRINGLGEDGISFINTGRGRDLGGLLLSLDTRGVEGAKLSFLAGTILQNERSYGIRLQYRTDLDAGFSNFVHNAQYVEYLSSEDGDTMLFEEITLPPVLLNRENVQLLWKYYHMEGESGPRAELRLDDIFVSDITTVLELSDDRVIIYASGQNLILRTKELFDGTVFLYDLSGRLVQSENVTGSDYYMIKLKTGSGLFIARIIGEKHSQTEKIFVN